MSKTYLYRTSGNLAGSRCTVRRCRNYARFGVSSMIDGFVPVASCGHHLAPVVKGLMVLHRTALAVQEIPGNWYNNGGEKAVVDGEILMIKPQQPE